MLKVNSRDRVSGTIGCASHTLQSPIAGVWGLQFAAIGVTWPNVRGRTLAYRLGGAPWVHAQVPDGYYGLSELLAWVNTLPLSCTFSEITNVLTFSSAQGIDVGKSELFGFPETTSGGAQSVSGSLMPNLSPTSCINIRVTGDSEKITDTKSRSFSLTIPLLVNQESVQVWSRKEFYNQTLDFIHPTRDLRVELCDDSGNILEPSHDWYMLLSP